MFTLGYVVTALVLFPSGADRIVTVPDLRGAPLEVARDRLRERELRLEGGSLLPHPRVPRGSVIAQTPLPGQEIAVGARVGVIVSAGPERRPVPNLAGMNQEQAVRALEMTGFEPRVIEVESDRRAGTVLSQRPAPEVPLTPPAAVRLEVSKGPPMVELPLVVGMDLSEARASLQASGLEVGRVRYDRFSWERDGVVVFQRPDGGRRVRKGTSVELAVAGIPPGERNNDEEETS